MILRKDYHLLYGVILVSLVISGSHCQEADSKRYDENEWIPIAPKHAQSVQPVVENVEKKVTGRVLNLAEPPANSFFPEEVKPIRNNNFQQYLRETTTYQKVPTPVQPQVVPVRVKQQLQHPYKFDSQRPDGPGVPNSRPTKPQKEFYVQQTPQQAQFVQYYQPQEYHTIPEEYLSQAVPQQQYFGQNFEIPDLPPIRLNASGSRLEKKPDLNKNENKENVQLLYVPLESLSPHLHKRPSQSELPRLHAYQQSPIVDDPPQFINYRPIPPAKQQQIHNIQSDFAKQAFDAHKLQLQFQQQQQPPPQEPYSLPYIEAATEPTTTTTTTKKPTSKKRKAHQPPLAVYMGGTTHADVSDVLTLLKDAKSIDVQDSVGPHSPKIFVGPSNIDAPRDYVKFELPYLSSLDTNRVERKVDQYPFFVAPLSYKAPTGYSKIPLPSPHVGSVVVSTKEKETRIPTQQVHNLPDAYKEFTLQNQPQVIPKYEYQQRPVPIISSTPRYSKPIPEDHVINQHEIDQINSFIPQFNENAQRVPEIVDHRFQETAQRGQDHSQRESDTVQRIPEKYHIETYKPATPSMRPSNIRFSSTVQPQLSEQQFIDEILQQQTKPPGATVRQEEYVRPAPIPRQNEGQFLQEVSRPLSSQEQYAQEDTNSKFENHPSTRTTHAYTPTRSRTTAAPPDEQYEEKEVTKPTRIRTRPTHTQTSVRESYEIPSRTTPLRSRPTPTPTPTTSESIDQYLKETVIEARPRPRPNTTPATEKPKYSIQEQFSIGRSTSPSPLQYSPVAQEYEEEIKSHRPVIFKYKQSEEIPSEYQPIYHSSTPISLVGQHQLNQEALGAKILSHESTGAGNYVTGPAHQVYQYQEEYEEPQQEQVKTQNANVENYNIAHVSEPHGQLPNLINNLEDQSVRQLLQPGLIPTSAKTSDVERYEVSTHAPLATSQAPTSNYPSTHLPVVETTTQRKVTRGRIRGSRFSTTTPSSDVSSTRRAPATRSRRPLTSRTRYQEDNEDSTENTPVRSTTDPTKKIVTARSRFRTRGRPVVETTDRVSSTYKQVDITPSHIQNSHPPSVQIIEPQVTQRIQQEYISYRPVYNVPVEESEPVLISRKRVSKPATEPVVIHQINQLPIKNLEEENTENTSSKLRVRGRRPSSTVTPQVETSRKYETETDDEGEEFYGFFRAPAFKQPTERAPPAETPRSIYSSTYVSSTLKPLIQQHEIEPQVRYHSSTENVQFIGEIRPKYQTTAQYFDPSQPSISTERFYHTTAKEVAEEEKPRIRTRARIPTRRIVASETSAITKVNEEPKTATQRVRTRGKTHYRVPQKPKKQHDSAEDEDVEGGNYPPQFKTYQTTPRPSFQITVDPQDDQEGFASIYRPTFLAKENNNKEVVEKVQGHWVENYQMPNYIAGNGKVDSDVPIALPSIATAPEVNQAIQEEQEKSYHNEESVEKIVEEMIHEYEDNADDKEVKTDASSTTIVDVDKEEEESPETTFTTVLPEATTHKRRRGVWKLVRRPVDVFEEAESQNAASNKNSLETNDKPDIIQHVEPEVDIEFTTLPMTTITEADTTTQTSSISSTTEGGFFDSLYDMFGITGGGNKSNKSEEIKDKEESDVTTTARSSLAEETLVPQLTETIEYDTQAPVTTTTTTIRPLVDIETTTPLISMTYITPMSFETWNKGILKTSTSTEISHETEICYKGKCIKSKDMKVPLT